MFRLPIAVWALAAVIAASPSQATPVFEEQVALGRASLRRALSLGDLSSLELARRAFLSAVEQAPDRRLGHYYLALANWQLGLALVSTPGTETRIAEIWREGARHCDLLLERDPRDAEALALRGGLKHLGARARPAEAAELGESGDADLRRSRTLAAGNPRVWLISGSTRYACRPGDAAAREDALHDLGRSLELFERVPQSLAELSGATPDPVGRNPAEVWGSPLNPGVSGTAPGEARPATILARLEPDWGHEEAWLTAGRLHLDSAHHDAARRCFQKVLELNPSSELVRENLLPRAGGAASGSRPSGGASRSLPGAPQGTPPGRPARAGLPR